MRKFLAVLLAVAILGVAGAAFAVPAGHVVIPDTKASEDKEAEAEAKITITDPAKAAETVAKKAAVSEAKDASGLAEENKKADVASDLDEKVETLVGEKPVEISASTVTVSEDTTTAAAKAEEYVAKKKAMAAALPMVTPKKSGIFEFIKELDPAYKGERLIADLRKGGTIGLAAALSADMAIFTDKAGKQIYEVPEDLTVVMVANLSKDTTYAPVILTSLAAVSEDLTKAGAAGTTIESTKATSTTLAVNFKVELTEDEKKEILSALNITSVAPMTQENATVAAAAAPTSHDKDVAFGLFTVTPQSTDNYIFEVDFSPVYSAAKGAGSMDLFDEGTQNYVRVAADTKYAFLGSDKKTKTTKAINGKGYVVMGLTKGETYKPTIAAEKVPEKKESTDPTSSKGSGGCNGGFAGIAVLALGLAALRRKAR